tara:strand:- start:85577 stop:86407 length:831 start_codon:yes stop_codon:yes gene_type:complete
MTTDINDKDEKIVKLWDEFDVEKAKGDKKSQAYLEARNRLIEVYYPMVFQIAKRMSYKLKDVTEDELSSFGVDGLMDAVEGFDRTMDVKFKTYAMYRIRGAILDNIRKVDWVPRLVRKRHSDLEQMRRKFEAEYGRPLTDSEMAERMGLTLGEYEDILRRSTPVALISMDARSRGEQDHETETIANIAMAEEKEPLDDMLRDEMYKKLLGKNFTPLERKIILMHYYEGLTMKDIADSIGFSESRISQLHGDIIRRLKKKIDCNPQYAEDLQRMLKV